MGWLVQESYIVQLFNIIYDVPVVREGNIPDIVACGSLYEFLCKIHEQYGPVASFWLGPTLCISIGSAKLFSQQSNAFDQACTCALFNISASHISGPPSVFSIILQLISYINYLTYLIVIF